jgi:hypothetical protein
VGGDHYGDQYAVSSILGGANIRMMQPDRIQSRFLETASGPRTIVEQTEAILRPK